MTENSLQSQIKSQKKIQKILFILNIFLMINVIGCLFLAIFRLILSFENSLITVIILFGVSFLLFQWCTSYRILSFTSVQFMRKNKILLFIYNILTLNILGIILVSKFIKDDNYNCPNTIIGEKALGYNQNLNNKAIYHINEAVHSYRGLVIWMGISTIIFAFAYIWSYKYMKYLDTHKSELRNVKNYNRTLFWTDIIS